MKTVEFKFINIRSLIFGQLVSIVDISRRKEYSDIKALRIDKVAKD